MGPFLRHSVVNFLHAEISDNMKAICVGLCVIYRLSASDTRSPKSLTKYALTALVRSFMDYCNATPALTVDARMKRLQLE